MSDLFNIPETLSPRLAWMKRHGVITRKWANGTWWSCLESDWEERNASSGSTEDEAITNLAKRLNIPLWNEEGFTK